MDLIDEIGTAVMRYQDWTQAYDEAVAKRYGLSPRELRCLSALMREPLSAKRLAAEVNLSASAVTALLDRLERRGFVQRTPDAQDRRGIVIRPTAKTRQLAQRMYVPIAADGRVFLGSFSRPELSAILRFVTGATELQERYVAKLAGTAKG